MNPHSAKHHRILSPARLPVPPLRLFACTLKGEKSITKPAHVVNKKSPSSIQHQVSSIKLRERVRAQVVRSIIVPAPLAGEGQGEGGGNKKRGPKSPFVFLFSSLLEEVPCSNSPNIETAGFSTSTGCLYIGITCLKMGPSNTQPDCRIYIIHHVHYHVLHVLRVC